MGTLEKPCLFAISAMILALFVATPAQAETNILFIVDGSNSMWGQIDNKAKMETAKTTLSKLVSDLPTDANLALMAYGHTREGDCNDVELLSAIGKDKPEMITTLIHTIQPKGKTPIANALAKSKDAFKGLEGQNNHILLVSDGIESCDGDPCAVAKSLQEAGLDVSAHVIGFGVSKEEGKQLTCIAENTGGKYFDAADTAAFNEAIEEVTQIAQAEPEPTPEPEPVIWFEDNFDGEDLSEHWEIINPNPNSYIVENGILTVLTTQDKPLSGNDELENVFLLNKGTPDGDWTATMRFTPKVATFKERYILALYKDKENMLTAETGAIISGYNTTDIRLWGSKIVDTTPTSYENRVLLSPQPPNSAYATTPRWQMDWTLANAKAILMRIEKSGRKYTVSSKLEGETTMADGKEPEWIRLQELTSLRPPGDSFVMALTQSAKVSGEAIMEIDWIKIESMEEPAPAETQPAAGDTE